MSSLPNLFVLQASDLAPMWRGFYLTINTSGDLQWVGGFPGTPGAKFAAEPSKSLGSRVVHIRSCHNNKYWVIPQDNRHRVRAIGDEPVEDTNDPACTLFRLLGSSPTFAFEPLSNPGWWLMLSSSGLSLGQRLGGPLGSDIYTYNVTDWETLVFLPSQVSLVSDDLGDHWAYSQVIDRRNYHRFDAGREIGNIRVAFELFPTQNRNYRIRNLHFNRFLRNATWIWADAESNDNSVSATFSFLDLRDGVFALRSLSTNRFCAPDTREGKVNCLRAEHLTLVPQTRLRVLERVLERTISDIRYRFEDSRIHQVESVEVTYAFAENNTNTPDVMTVTFSIEESHTTTWKSSISVTLGVKVQLRVTIIPVILRGKLEASAQFNFTQEWEETKTRTTKTTLAYQVTVPPFSRRKVTLVCMKSVCDVPYSYTQQDLLPDGRRVNSTKDDGIFYGVNSYEFDVESTDAFEDALGRMYV